MRIIEIENKKFFELFLSDSFKDYDLYFSGTQNRDIKCIKDYNLDIECLKNYKFFANEKSMIEFEKVECD